VKAVAVKAVAVKAVAVEAAGVKAVAVESGTATNASVVKAVDVTVVAVLVVAAKAVAVTAVAVYVDAVAAVVEGPVLLNFCRFEAVVVGEVQSWRQRRRGMKTMLRRWKTLAVQTDVSCVVDWSVVVAAVVASYCCYCWEWSAVVRDRCRHLLAA